MHNSSFTTFTHTSYAGASALGRSARGAGGMDSPPEDVVSTGLGVSAGADGGSDGGDDDGASLVEALAREVRDLRRQIQGNGRADAAGEEEKSADPLL